MVTIEFDGYYINTYGAGDELLRNTTLKNKIIPKFRFAVINHNLDILLGDELLSVEFLMDGRIMFKYIDAEYEQEICIAFTPDKYGTDGYVGDIRKICETKYDMINAIISKNGLIDNFYSNSKKEEKPVVEEKKEETVKDE